MARKTIEEKITKKPFIFAVGRRKEAVARVRLYPVNDKSIQIGDQSLKPGQILVNGKPVEEYFGQAQKKPLYYLPFELTKTTSKFVATVKVEGGGLVGQLDAFIHGISRALEKYDKDKFHGLLKKQGLLTRDARVRQRRMVGMGGKSRRKKQSPKR